MFDRIELLISDCSRPPTSPLLLRGPWLAHFFDSPSHPEDIFAKKGGSLGL